MERKNYEDFVKCNFNKKTQDLILSQINNFYHISEKPFKNKKYKLGEDVILNKHNLMTGFKLDFDYLNLNL